MEAIEIPQQKELEAAISGLQVFMDIDAVTLHEANTAGKQGYILTIILEKDSNVIASEMYGWVGRVLKRQASITYRIVDIRDVIHYIKSANLYYIKWYLGSIYLFQTEKFGQTFQKKICNVSSLTAQAVKSFTGQISRAEAMQRGAQHYAGTNSHLLALHTIYQAIVYLFGIGGKLVMGRAHNISIWAQQETLKDFAPALASLFDRSNADDCEIADLLHKANRDFPHYGKMKVRKELVITAYKKMQRLLKEVKKAYREQLAYCETKLLTYTEPIAEPAEAAAVSFEAKISKVITRYMKTAAIFCFGKREGATTHFYLLIFEREHKENAVHDLGDIIKSKTKGQCSATLLIHDVTEIAIAKGEQRTFFLNVIATGETLYKQASINELTLVEQAPPRDYKQAVSYLQNRNLIVNQISEWQGEYEWANYSPLKAVMLHHIVEQACLGMLKLFLGYTPNHFALGYLLELCEYFAPSAGRFFPRSSDEDKRLFKILSRYSWTLRYSGDDDVDFEAMSVLQTRCNDFADYAQEVIQKELERIQDDNPLELKF